MALMTVYHGSGDVVAAPEIRVGRYTKDFGPGFYCTVIREQAASPKASTSWSFRR